MRTYTLTCPRTLLNLRGQEPSSDSMGSEKRQITKQESHWKGLHPNRGEQLKTNQNSISKRLLISTAVTAGSQAFPLSEWVGPCDVRVRVPWIQNSVDSCSKLKNNKLHLWVSNPEGWKAIDQREMFVLKMREGPAARLKKWPELWFCLLHFH